MQCSLFNSKAPLSLKNEAYLVLACSMTVGQSNLTSLLGEHSKREPPDPIPNSEVKPLCADDSVAGCHVKVGHRQALINKARLIQTGFFLKNILHKFIFEDYQFDINCLVELNEDNCLGGEIGIRTGLKIPRL